MIIFFLSENNFGLTDYYMKLKLSVCITSGLFVGYFLNLENLRKFKGKEIESSQNRSINKTSINLNLEKTSASHIYTCIIIFFLYLNILLCKYLLGWFGVSLSAIGLISFRPSMCILNQFTIISPALKNYSQCSK